MADVTATVVYATACGVKAVVDKFRESSLAPKIKLLDPVSTVLKLLLLSYSEPTTKISVNNGTVTLQPPGTRQSMIRWINGDDRDDLFQLKYPIYYFIGMKNDFYKSPCDTDTLTHICAGLIDGLRELKKTYCINDTSMVQNCIDSYILALTKEYTETDYELELQDIDKSVLFLVYEQFTMKWTQESLYAIIEIEKLLNSTTVPQSKTLYLKAIDAIVSAREQEINVTF